MRNRGRSWVGIGSFFLGLAGAWALLSEIRPQKLSLRGDAERIQRWVSGLADGDDAKANPPLWSEIEDRIQQVLPVERSPVGGRSIASSNDVCLRDRIHLERLKPEAEGLKSQSPKSNFSKNWRGLNLGSLRQDEAEYLNELGATFPKNFLSYSRFTSLESVINRSYHPQASEEALRLSPEGWRISHFFRKAGYPISVPHSFFLPESYFSEAKKEFELPGRKPGDFLFEEKTLESLNLLSYILPNTLIRIPRLKSLNKMPELHANEAERLKWGLRDAAHLKKNSVEAHIFIRDPNQNPISSDGPVRLGDSNYFLLTLVHELAHAWSHSLSLTQGRTPPERDTAWSQVSGWSIMPEAPLSGVSEKKTGIVLVHVESRQEGAEPPFRKYGLTSSSEDFADSVAYFRLRASEMLQKTPLRARYISDLLFEGRTFDDAGLEKFYLSQVRTGAQRSWIASAQYCVEKSRAESQNIEGFEGCLHEQLRILWDEAVRVLKYEEWEACDFFEREGDALFTEFKSNYLEEIEKLRQSWIQGSIETHSARSQKIAQAMLGWKQNFDPRDAVLQCREENQPEACYQSILLSELERSMNQSLGNWSHEELAALQLEFMSRFPYSYYQSKARDLLEEFSQSQKNSTETGALQLGSECIKNESTSNVNPALLMDEPFSGGEDYLAPQLLQCINTKIKTRVRSAWDAQIANLNGSSEGALRSLSEPARQQLLGRLLSDWVFELRKWAKVASEEGKLAWRTYVQELNLDLVRFLKNNRDWFQASMDPEKLLDRCVESSRSFWDLEMKKDPDPFRQPWVDFREGQLHESRRVCEELIESSEFQEALKKAEKEAYGKILIQVETHLEARAKSHKKDCQLRVARVSSEVERNKKYQICFQNESSWETLEALATIDLFQTQEGKKWRPRIESIKAALRSRRTYFQKKFK